MDTLPKGGIWLLAAQKPINKSNWWKGKLALFQVLALRGRVAAAAAAAKSLQSCPTLCDPIDGSPPGSPVPGILQARTLEWVAISFSKAWKWKHESAVTQSCLTLNDPMDCSLLQARVLEWGAIAFSDCKTLFDGTLFDALWWSKGEGNPKIQKRGDICIHLADPL